MVIWDSSNYLRAANSQLVEKVVYDNIKYIKEFQFNKNSLLSLVGRGNKTFQMLHGKTYASGKSLKDFPLIPKILLIY